jgi:hypothetical protein
MGFRCGRIWHGMAFNRRTQTCEKEVPMNNGGCVAFGVLLLGS